MVRSRVELFERIRRDSRVEHLSIRELADSHGLHRRTVRRALGSAVPPPRKVYARRAGRKSGSAEVTADNDDKERTWTSGGTSLGSTPNGGAGAQGITDAPGKLFPFTLKRTLPAGATTVVGSSTGTAAVDALLIQPFDLVCRRDGIERGLHAVHQCQSRGDRAHD